MQCRRSFFLIAATVLAAACAGSAAAAICMVNTTADIEGSTDDPSLRYCINFLNGRPGTTHTLRFATPPNSILKLEASLPAFQGRPFKIDGANRAPIVDGQGQHSIFTFGAGASATILKLTLRNGYREGGGGACVQSADPTSGSITLEDVEIRGCVSEFTSPGDGCGGALQSDYPISINSVRFRDNHALAAGGDVAGGAICAGDKLTVRGGFFSGNDATASGGGVARGGAVYAAGEVTITGSQFMSNSAIGSSAGGGLYVAAGPGLLLNRNAFFDNRAGRGSGLYMAGNAGGAPPLLADNNSFVGNHGDGALYVEGPYTLHNNTFWANSSLTPGEGAHLIATGPEAIAGWFTLNLLAPTALGDSACSASALALPEPEESAFNAFPDDSCSFLGDPSANPRLSRAQYDIRSFRRERPPIRFMPAVEMFIRSLALDAVPYAEPDADGNYYCAEVDARGQSRVSAVNDCDIGALEAVPEASLFADGMDQPLLRPEQGAFRPDGTRRRGG